VNPSVQGAGAAVARAGLQARLRHAMAVGDPRRLMVLARNGIPSSITVTLVALALAALHWKNGQQVWIAAWMLGFVAVRLVVIAVCLKYQREARESTEMASHWVSTVIWLGFAQGLAWGLGGFVLVEPGNIVNEALLHVTVATIALSVVPTLAHFYPALVAYILPVFLGLAARNLWVGDAHHAALAGLVLIAGTYGLAAGWAYARIHAENRAQREENQRLIEALSIENEATRSAQQRAEAAQHAQGRLFAAANHDLRQPLHAIGLMAQSLRAATPAQAAELGARISDCVDDMDRLVEELLDLARAESTRTHLNPATVDVQALAAELIGIYGSVAQAKRLQLFSSVQPLVLNTDRALLRRILVNLLSNAIRYTPRGEVELGAKQDAAEIRVFVRDTGIGIAPEEHVRVFDAFYQVPGVARGGQSGFGLGLATVRRFAHSLGGRITLTSSPGQGSTFSLHLPRGALESLQSGEAAVPAPDALRGLRVLLVDDDPRALAAMQSLLADWGCEVRACAGIAQALDAAAEGLAPQLLLTDVYLDVDHPDQTGFVLVERLRALYGQLPAVLISGESDADVLAQARASGLALLRKPVRPIQLRATLSHLRA
jgi:signal transduction histidine kinase